MLTTYNSYALKIAENNFKVEIRRTRCLRVNLPHYSKWKTTLKIPFVVCRCLTLDRGYRKNLSKERDENINSNFINSLSEDLSDVKHQDYIN